MYVLRYRKDPLVTLLALAACCAPAAVARAQQGAAAIAGAQPLSECEVIARVNSEVILACELEWQVRLLIEQKLGPDVAPAIMNSPVMQDTREEILKNLTLSRIEMALLYADFRSKAPQADLGAIQKQLEGPFEETEVPRLMESVGVETRAELEEKLHSLGTSLPERRDEFVRTMIARQWLQNSVKINREVTHEQLVEFYHEHEADYAQPERVRWEELMVRFDKHPSKSEAYAALARLGNAAYAAVTTAPAGEPAFATLAPQQSDGFTAADGGGYDWTSQGSLASMAIDQALFELPVGQMSPILEGPMGFHIVRVLERREAGPTPFRDVQAQIREDLYDDRFGKAINAKMTELKKSARLWTVFTGDLTYEQLAEMHQTSRR